MSLDQIRTIIEEAMAAGMWRLQIVGGEPMMRDDLGEIIKYAKGKDCFVSLSSNGYRIAERVADLRGLDVALLSFDGPEEIHDEVKGKGSYRGLRQAMDALRKNNIKFWTTTVLTARNLDCIDFILKMAEEKDFWVVFQPVYYTGTEFPQHIHKGEVAEKLKLKDSDFRTTVRRLIKLKRGGARIASSPAYLHYLLRWGDCTKPYSEVKRGRVSCLAGKLYCYIDTNGLVFPCGDSGGRIPAPQVTEVGFRKAFAGLTPPPCASCIIACDLEKNLMFSFSPSAVWNWLKLLD